MSLPASVQQLLDGKIDFEGQKTVDTLTRFVLVTLTAVSFVLGCALQSLRATFGLYGVGVAVLLLVVIPPWPMYNAHPVQWLPALEEKKTR
ncbi:microsomal signal peptidase 12 kDa subunit [Dentipellis sp. KUC8613]|nr:microsomal signal peptidase 12 kDa subunit [Dentipellis sp. KUC8613]